MSSRPVLFELISTRAAWLGQRQAVLGQNVANADTPGYLPRDLQPLRFDGMLGAAPALAPAQTDPGHLAARADARAPFKDRVDPAQELKPSGNGVDLPEELRKMGSTELDHQLATGLYRRYVAMLRTAIGVPQG